MFWWGPHMERRYSNKQRDTVRDASRPAAAYVSKAWPGVQTHVGDRFTTAVLNPVYGDGVGAGVEHRGGEPVLNSGVEHRGGEPVLNNSIQDCECKLLLQCSGGPICNAGLYCAVLLCIPLCSIVH